MHKNTISDLVKILPPPAAPLDYDEVQLKRNEDVLSTSLPSDFVEFGRIYGSGRISTSAYSWEVWSPYRATYPLIVLQFARTLNIYRDAMEITDMSFGVFPEEKSVLPFATTPNGDWVCWVTKGEPDEWSVVDLERYDHDGYEELDMGFSEYFCSVLTRQHVLERHKRGKVWDPKKDLEFGPEVFMDQGL